MKKAYLIVGSLLIFLGSILITLHNIPVFVTTYEIKDKYQANAREHIEVTGFFYKGDHFFFNFSSGKYWGGDPLTEPYEPSCDLGEAYIPEHKVVIFQISTPSKETCIVEARLPYGLYTFAIIYANKSDDFAILSGGNLTWGNVGIEGIVNKEGKYTIRAMLIMPAVYKTRIGEGEPLQIEDDPPQEMTLWLIQIVETKPYFILLPIGATSVMGGVILVILSPLKSKKRRLKRTKHKKGGI
jgi:hypothetical protein